VLGAKVLKLTKQKNFFSLWKQTLDRKDLENEIVSEAMVKAVFTAIISYRNNKKPPYQCNPSYEKIMLRSGIGSKTTISEVIKRLKELDIMYIVKKGRSNWYYFTNEPPVHTVD
jgi:hypothetical protein